MKCTFGISHLDIEVTYTTSSQLPSYLDLEWIYGYNSTDRSNVHYLTSPEDEDKKGCTRFVYPAASQGIVYHKFDNTQHFYASHTDTILSLTVHPGGVYVASGQRGRKADVHVWNGLTQETVAVLPLHTTGVNMLSWGFDGSKLVSVGMDKDHTVAFWDWQARKILASGVCGEATMLDVAISEDGKTICVVGIKTVLFFDIDGRALRAKPGIITSKGKVRCIDS